MSTEVKTAPIVAPAPIAVPKPHCIALKADRTQCVRNASDGIQFCWQHANKVNKNGTILEPAPQKPKSNRGRPKGSVAKKDLNIIPNVAPTSDLSLTASVAPVEPLLMASIAPIEALTSMIVPNPPNKTPTVNLDLLKNLSWKITVPLISDSTMVANGPFELQFDIGAENHICLPKTLKFVEGEYSLTNVHAKIIEFFETQATGQDLADLVKICDDAENEELSQVYAEMHEEDGVTYNDLQCGLDVFEGVTVRDSKYVAIMGDS